MATHVKTRCSWASSDPLYIDYHDNEWGVPIHDERLLFEFICLEGQQAGLSWITVLKKRENYRRAFKNFEPAKVARMKDQTIEKLLNDTGLIRNRLKLFAIRENAKCFLDIQDQYGSFDKYIWSFVDGKPIMNSWQSLKQVPTRTPISDAMAKDLKKKGLKFVGTTICYAFMQAAGLVNDHVKECYLYRKAR